MKVLPILRLQIVLFFHELIKKGYATEAKEIESDLQPVFPSLQLEVRTLLAGDLILQVRESTPVL